MTFQPNNSNAVFLPTTIQYPKEPDELISRLNKAYEDTATRLNVKQIGIFDLVEFLSGEQWFTAGNPQVKRQAFRHVFTLTATGNIPHNISALTQVLAYGEYTDGTNFYGLIYGSNVAIPGQVSFYVTPANIVVLAGAGAPAITSGVIVLEYLKN